MSVVDEHPAHDFADPPHGEYRHEALLYEGDDGFLAGALAFIRDGLSAEEPIIAALPEARIALLREALGRDATEVSFADMADMGRNPARMIPAWHAFIRERRTPGGAVRGIGELIWAGRTAAEVVECHLHESLVDLAFAGEAGVRLLCAYDASTLAPGVLREARCSHRTVVEGRSRRTSPDYRRADHADAPFHAALEEPHERCELLAFDLDSLPGVRELVSRRARQVALGRLRSDDLVLAVHELATNSIRHGGGRGVLRVWRDGAGLACEVADDGHIGDPLAGRHTPTDFQLGGRGLWLANQLCDLVQIRSTRAGTVVRVTVQPR